MDTIVGIDLGTTNSEVAIIRDGQPVVLRTRTATRSCPRSSASTRRAGCSSAGRPGTSSCSPPSGPSARSSGRWARKSRSPWATRSTRPRRSRRSSSGRSSSRAEKALGQPVTKAVITVPAFFNDGPAAGDPRGGRAGRPGGRPDHQRADRRRAHLRPPPARAGAAARLRPRRRHVRRLDRPGRGGRRRDPRQPRRHAARAATTSTSCCSTTSATGSYEKHGIDLRQSLVGPSRASSAPSRRPRRRSRSTPSPGSRRSSSPRRTACPCT